MRIACLQFAPELGKTANNIIRADRILEAATLSQIDLLVLPELAFTGYNYPSLSAILPYLEPTASGCSTVWAKATAAHFNCIVTIGYPELYAATSSLEPISNTSSSLTYQPTAYNSTITVSPAGKILAHYRKTHLYYTDETWAQESPSGWLTTGVVFEPNTKPDEELQAAFGICMDLNSYKFQAEWNAYEFANAAKKAGAEILVLSMAWLSTHSTEVLEVPPGQPDLQTLSYWIERLRPLVEQDKEVIIVCANRCGEEPGNNPIGQEEGVEYAGSSWVGRIGRGQINIWGILGRGEEGVLGVDMGEEPMFVLKMRAANGDVHD
ncbi:Carbon-nitrogen hydrolase [Puttea exsequens]|nr:Carbon-nitrogen hydrolase [Puttea exsequens]